MGETCRKEWDDLFGLNIWWNLKSLRGPSRKNRLLGFSVFFHNFFWHSA
jgi:hypothetical protein